VQNGKIIKRPIHKLGIIVNGVILEEKEFALL